MLLPFSDGLVETWRCDPECALLADRHYSRQTVGASEFVGNGSPLVLRSADGLEVFAWLMNRAGYRLDKQEGFNCTIFRNEGPRRSSDIILEAECHAVSRWGRGRAFTYIDATKVQSVNPGYCFKVAGWKRVGYSKSGKHLLEKWL